MMKSMKKVLVLIFVMCFLCSGVVFAGQTEDKTSEAYGIGLTDENGNFIPTVTRAQMAKLACRLLQLSETAEAETVTKPVFSDVSPEHPEAGYLFVAKSMGVICGYPDGSFLPEQEISSSEALKILIAILGYLPKAEEMGGYPHGVVMVANQIGLTKELAFDATKPAGTELVAKLVENALDIPLMVQTGWGEFQEYQISELSIRKNLEKELQ